MWQIEMMIDGLLRILRDSSQLPSEMEPVLAVDTYQTEDDAFRTNVFSLLHARKICDAENLIFERMKPGNRFCFETALVFYQQINAMQEDELQTCHFSHEEVEGGLRSLANIYVIEIDALF